MFPGKSFVNILQTLNMDRSYLTTITVNFFYLDLKTQYIKPKMKEKMGENISFSLQLIKNFAFVVHILSLFLNIDSHILTNLGYVQTDSDVLVLIDYAVSSVSSNNQNTNNTTFKIHLSSYLMHVCENFSIFSVLSMVLYLFLRV